MPAYHAKNTYGLVGKESTWGTAVSATKDLGLFQNITINTDRELTNVFSIAAVDVQSIDEGHLKGTGNFELVAQHGRILEYLLGSVAHDAASTPDIKHTFTLADTPPSFTLELGASGTTDYVPIVKGCMITSGVISQDLKGHLKVKGDFIFRDVDPSGTSAGTAVVSTLKPFKNYLTTLSWGTESSESAQSIIKNWEISVNNAQGGDVVDYGMESHLGQAAEINNRLITFKFAQTSQGPTLWQHMLGNTSGVLDTGAEITTKGLVIDVTNGVALASGRRQWHFDFSGCKLSPASEAASVGIFNAQDFSGSAKTLDSCYTYDNITQANW